MQGEQQVKLLPAVISSFIAAGSNQFDINSSCEQKPAGKIIKFGTNIDLSDPKK